MTITAGNDTWHGTLANMEHVIPTAGKFKQLNIKIGTAPGAAASGKKYTYTLMVNGSPSSTITGEINETETTLTVTADQAISAGDTVCIRSVPTGTPDTNSRFEGNIIWEPTIDEEYIILGHDTEVLHTSATEFHQFFATTNIVAAWHVSEGNSRQTIGQAGTYKKLAVKLNTDPSPGNFVFTVMHATGIAAGTATSMTVTCTSTTAVIDTNTQAVADGDTLNFRCVPNSAPTVGFARWSCVFVPTTAGYISMPQRISDLTPVTATEYSSFPMNISWGGTESNKDIEMVNIGITVRSIRVNSGAPGSGKNRKFSLMKDSSPLTNLDLIIADTATTGATTGQAEAIVAGEVLSTRIIPTNSPTATAAGVSWTFTYAGLAGAPTRTAYQGIYNSSGMI